MRYIAKGTWTAAILAVALVGGSATAMTAEALRILHVQRSSSVLDSSQATVKKSLSETVSEFRSGGISVEVFVRDIGIGDISRLYITIREALAVTRGQLILRV